MARAHPGVETSGSRRVWALVLALSTALVLAGCRTEMRVTADVEGEMTHFGVEVVAEGLIADVITDDAELAAAIKGLIEETLETQVVAAADGREVGGRVSFTGVEAVPAATVTLSSEITGVRLIAKTGREVSVVLTQPQGLVEAIREAGAADPALVSAVLEATSVVVVLTGTEGATLGEGVADEVEFSGSHLTIRRPLSSVGEARYLIELRGVDPIVYRGLVVVGAVLVGAALYLVLRRRGGGPGYGVGSGRRIP